MVKKLRPLSAVSVTAKGYASDDLETPVSTTTLDRGELQRQGANNPGEALRGKPGLAVASDGARQLRASLQQHTDRDVWYPGSAPCAPSQACPPCRAKPGWTVKTLGD